MLKYGVSGADTIEVAKNYLNEKELEILNRMVTAYLELAELQALNGKPKYMKDWVVYSVYMTSRVCNLIKILQKGICFHIFNYLIIS